jgi:hypothetical protein
MIQPHFLRAVEAVVHRVVVGFLTLVWNRLLVTTHLLTVAIVMVRLAVAVGRQAVAVLVEGQVEGLKLAQVSQ